MLIKISLLTAFLLASLYPLCFWVSYKNPLKNNFHKFHLGLPNVIGGVVVVWLMFMDIPLSIKILVLVWKAGLIAFSQYYWKKEYPQAVVMTIPCLLGTAAFSYVESALIPSQFLTHLLSILGGLILCASLFAMNLGHWYLNVHGLPIAHLKRAVNILAVFLILRLLADMILLFFQKILYLGDFIRLFSFLGTLDGFLLILALFFGVLFPLASLYFVYGTLKVKNTQAATGILYVILASILMGDLTYKYYLVKFGVIW